MNESARDPECYNTFWWLVVQACTFLGGYGLKTQSKAACAFVAPRAILIKPDRVKFWAVCEGKWTLTKNGEEMPDRQAPPAVQAVIDGLEGGVLQPGSVIVHAPLFSVFLAVFDSLALLLSREKCSDTISPYLVAGFGLIKAGEVGKAEQRELAKEPKRAVQKEYKASRR